MSERGGTNGLDIYRETLRAPLARQMFLTAIAIGAIAFFALTSFAHAPLAISAFSIMCLSGFATVLALSKLDIRVSAHEIEVSAPLRGGFNVPISEIEDVSPKTYRPFADFGLWGEWGGFVYARMFHKRAYEMGGGTGVHLRTAAGHEYLVGSSNPSALAAAIRQAKKAVT